MDRTDVHSSVRNGSEVRRGKWAELRVIEKEEDKKIVGERKRTGYLEKRWGRKRREEKRKQRGRKEKRNKE